MIDYFTWAGAWIGQSIVAGSLVLAVGWLFMARAVTPKARIAVAQWSLRAAILVPLLCLLPSWWGAPVRFLDTTEETSTNAMLPLQQSTLQLSMQEDPTPPGGASGAIGLHAENKSENLVPQTFGPPNDRPTVVAMLELPAEKGITLAEARPDFRPTVGDLVDDVAPGIPAIHVDDEVSRRGAPNGMAFTAPALLAENAQRQKEAELADALRHELPTLDDALVGLALLFSLLAIYFAAEFACGVWRLHRLCQESTPASMRLQALLAGLHNKPKSTPRLLTHPTVATPICFGVIQPTIILPWSMAKQLSAEELTWILAHECEHLRNGDARLAWLLALNRCWYGVVPWFWSLRRKVGLAQEQLADAAAVAAGGKAADYAAFLVKLSSGTTSPTGSGALPALGVRAGRSQLFRRISMIVDVQNRAIAQRRSRMGGAVTAGCLLSVAVVLSGFSLTSQGYATADEQQKSNPIEAQKQKPSEEQRETNAKEIPKGNTPPAPEAKPEAPRLRLVEPGRGPVTERLMMVNPEKLRNEIRELRERIAKAAKDNKPAELEELFEQLERKFDELNRRIMELPGRVVPVPAVPPTLPTPAAPGKPAPPTDVPGVRGFVQEGNRVFVFPEKIDDATITELKRLLGEIEDKKAREALKQIIEAIERKAPFPFTQSFSPDAILPGGIGGFGPLGILPSPRMPMAVIRADFVNDVPPVLAAQLDLEPNTGVVVNSLGRNSRLSQAGIKPFDIILELDGQTVKNAADFYAQVTRQKDEEYKITYLRKGKKMEATVPALNPLAEDQFNPREEPKFGFSQIQSQINNDQFNVKGTSGKAVYQLSGTITNGELKVDSFTVTVNGKEKKSNELPAEDYRAARTLLDTIR